jgi:hypothetical protein
MADVRNGKVYEITPDGYIRVQFIGGSEIASPLIDLAYHGADVGDVVIVALFDDGSGAVLAVLAGMAGEG